MVTLIFVGLLHFSCTQPQDCNYEKHLGEFDSLHHKQPFVPNDNLNTYKRIQDIFLTFYKKTSNNYRSRIENDSSIVIHYFKNLNVKSSVSIDFKNKISYNYIYDARDSLSVCSLEYNDIFGSFQDLISTKSHIVDPLFAAKNNHEGMNVLLVEVIRYRRVYTYIIDLKGLPREYYVEGSFEIKPDSRWGYLLSTLK
ncbi:MAG: hypothetical protein NXI20_10195 [bacterium]|nr:hypothetical protein [bacterium]